MEQELTEREKELIAKLSEAEQAKENLTGEIIAQRAKTQEKEAEAERLKQELQKSSTPVNAGKDTEEVVKGILEKEKSATREKLREQAEEEFKKSVRDFNSDVDAGGILYEKFKKEMAKFNFSGLETKEEFIQRMKDAYALFKPNKTSTPVNFYPGNEGAGTDPRISTDDNLSPVELKLCAEMNWTKERYLQQKAKRPVFIENMLRYRR